MLKLDLTGLNCPIPVLRTKKFLANLDKDVLIEVITTDPASLYDMQDFCNKTGHVLVSQKSINNQIISIIKHK